MARSSKKSDKNLFCELADLENEASVEQFFVSRMLEHLGFTDRQIKPKTSLEKIKVSVGRRKVGYIPDYAVVVSKKARWICDAKATDEDLDKWVGQGGSYCLELNRKYRADNPVEYFVLSNGVETRVYKWDAEEPLLTLAFADFVDGNAKYDKFRSIVGPEAFNAKRGAKTSASTITLTKKSANDLNADFTWCHNQIHKKGDLSYTAAFMEFVKLVFLKLLSDRDIHRRHPEFSDRSMKSITIDASEVKFSVAWIENAESLGTENPMTGFSSPIWFAISKARSRRARRSAYSHPTNRFTYLPM